MAILRLYGKARALGKWAYETARDVWWEFRHTLAVNGTVGTPPIRWMPFDDRDGECLRAVFGRVEILVRQDAVREGWFFQLQDVATFEPLHVSFEDYDTANEAKAAAVRFVMVRPGSPQRPRASLDGGIV